MEPPRRVKLPTSDNDRTNKSLTLHRSNLLVHTADHLSRKGAARVSARASGRSEGQHANKFTPFRPLGTPFVENHVLLETYRAALEREAINRQWATKVDGAEDKRANPESRARGLGVGSRAVAAAGGASAGPGGAASGEDEGLGDGSEERIGEADNISAPAKLSHTLWGRGLLPHRGHRLRDDDGFDTLCKGIRESSARVNMCKSDTMDDATESNLYSRLLSCPREPGSIHEQEEENSICLARLHVHMSNQKRAVSAGSGMPLSAREPCRHNNESTSDARMSMTTSRLTTPRLSTQTTRSRMSRHTIVRPASQRSPRVAPRRGRPHAAYQYPTCGPRSLGSMLALASVQMPRAAAGKRQSHGNARMSIDAETSSPRDKDGADRSPERGGAAERSVAESGGFESEASPQPGVKHTGTASSQKSTGHDSRGDRAEVRRKGDRQQLDKILEDACSKAQRHVNKLRAWHRVDGERPLETGEEMILVAGAGGSGFETNGIYERLGLHNGRPKYKQVDGQSTIYWDDGWNIMSNGDTAEWCYRNTLENGQLPPAGQWTSKSGIDPAPEISYVKDEEDSEGDRPKNQLPAYLSKKENLAGGDEKLRGRGELEWSKWEGDEKLRELQLKAEQQLTESQDAMAQLRTFLHSYNDSRRQSAGKLRENFEMMEDAPPHVLPRMVRMALEPSRKSPMWHSSQAKAELLLGPGMQRKGHFYEILEVLKDVEFTSEISQLVVNMAQGIKGVSVGISAKELFAWFQEHRGEVPYSLRRHFALRLEMKWAVVVTGVLERAAVSHAASARAAVKYEHAQGATRAEVLARTSSRSADRYARLAVARAAAARKAVERAVRACSSVRQLILVPREQALGGEGSAGAAPGSPEATGGGAGNKAAIKEVALPHSPKEMGGTRTVTFLTE